MLKRMILPLGILGIMLVGCGGEATEERVELQKLEMLQELKESKMYRGTNTSDWDKVTAAITNAEGEQ